MLKTEGSRGGGAEKRNRNYETVLPAGYREIFSVDCEDVKTILLLSAVSLYVGVVLIAAACLILNPFKAIEQYSILANLLFLIVMVAYIVLHEAVHGVAYKALTGQKLTFGITVAAAYCGVPHVYVYRRAALIALLAPFVVFSVVFGAVIVFCADVWIRFFAAVLLAIHIGGCVGDLYDAALYLFRFRDPLTLMRDTGPKQSFYLRE